MKIIQTNKFRKHMTVHKQDFFKPYQYLIKWCNKNGVFNDLKEQFEIRVVEFPFNIGQCTLVETTDKDEVVYAKRTERGIYTRFVKNREPYKINKCVVCLNRSRENEDEYFIITMYPGAGSRKEPEDKNINTIDELSECLQFWNAHALIYNPGIIDGSTVTAVCPYDKLYDFYIYNGMAS